MGEEGRALLGDADAAGGAVEQAGGQLVLEGLDALGDRAGGQAQLAADRGEVLHRRDTGKDAHILDVHALGPRCVPPFVFSPLLPERRRSSIIFVLVRTVALSAAPSNRN